MSDPRITQLNERIAELENLVKWLVLGHLGTEGETSILAKDYCERIARETGGNYSEIKAAFDKNVRLYREKVLLDFETLNPAAASLLAEGLPSAESEDDGKDV